MTMGFGVVGGCDGDGGPRPCTPSRCHEPHVDLSVVRSYLRGDRGLDDLSGFLIAVKRLTEKKGCRDGPLSCASFLFYAADQTARAAPRVCADMLRQDVNLWDTFANFILLAFEAAPVPSEEQLALAYAGPTDRLTSDGMTYPIRAQIIRSFGSIAGGTGVSHRTPDFWGALDDFLVWCETAVMACGTPVPPPVGDMIDGLSRVWLDLTARHGIDHEVRVRWAGSAARVLLLLRDADLLSADAGLGRWRQTMMQLQLRLVRAGDPARGGWDERVVDGLEAAAGALRQVARRLNGQHDKTINELFPLLRGSEPAPLRHIFPAALERFARCRLTYGGGGGAGGRPMTVDARLVDVGTGRRGDRPYAGVLVHTRALRLNPERDYAGPDDVTHQTVHGFAQRRSIVRPAPKAIPGGRETDRGGADGGGAGADEPGADEPGAGDARDGQAGHDVELSEFELTAVYRTAAGEADYSVTCKVVRAFPYRGGTAWAVCTAEDQPLPDGFEGFVASLPPGRYRHEPAADGPADDPDYRPEHRPNPRRGGGPRPGGEGGP